ncbi:(Fe-S)-binding protein [Candidatus Oscillochloris fontis]|uniref:(Fe-S)-binding protein n=1 Tax=Candidatus Oscillochloris fontis TaxID=2496868 RepID=UPI00101DD99C|nr:heterodisulfide reductase-related iron-sulfur binding cluster [Candidatus Oscillochloris fontis]
MSTAVDQPAIPLIPFSNQDRPSSEIINTCVHCGLCLSACPTYRETGLETASPRGRIYLMKAVDEGRIGLESAVFQEQMSLCLNCRACEAACPSGVQYGLILEASRAQIEQARHAPPPALPARPLWQRALRGAVFGALFNDMRLFRGFATSMALYQQSGIQWLARRSGALHLLGLAETERLLPTLSGQATVPMGQIYPADGPRRYSVALLTGCIMSSAFSHVHAATIRVLQKNGCEVILPPDQGCCGALHTHGGDLDGGRALARRNIAAFSGLGVDAIIVNAAGCGSTMKEYAHLLHDDPEWYVRAEAFVAMVKDVHEFLAGIELNTRDLRPLNLRVTYQEPCHLAHAQRISGQPRNLLQAIPGLELIEMAESALCCGSAGVYNITQPEMAAALGVRKVRNALSTGARVIATANPGCALQIVGELQRRGEHVQVHYIVELLDAAYIQE